MVTIRKSSAITGKKKVTKSAKSNKVKTNKTTKVTKSQSKSTKSKIQKLNANDSEIREITSLLGTNVAKGHTKALDSRSLQADLKKDEQTRADNKKVENDLTSQLELLTGMGL
ncbi:predicted protein [Scheffersomyces stipitis CBS 6054]|uniref:Uncharacterized protein n=1 Tax=Scheffersomyces stipitis (strain ATCC 58785 / CBS 6054 / NBRC 10063 / NRRL Y-11545) TaxID=322104 RepID=A3LNK0_PICST|nr:predicted protein [Scheffersomyces stipitis CBS 6054]ABN64345.2 predicted protein [Scheffersomyces stipitis CBS 6054]KAG2736258.1 hypothetical protein G9P44_000348 [Scheffersomyces stipitis]